jgi:MFS family permease
MSRAAGARPGFVFRGFLFRYGLAYSLLWVALLTPVIVTLALKIEAISGSRTAHDLSLVLGAGALCAMFGNPVFGALSDRTASRFGRRRPWLVGGTLVGLAALIAIGASPSITIILIAWCIAQLAFNAVLAAFVAVLPDQVPIEQRGTVSGVLGVCMPIGQIAGTYLVQLFAHDIGKAVIVPGLIGTAGVLMFAFTIHDPYVPASPRPPRANFLARFLIDPRRDPDFAWAWISRVFFVIGTSALSTYQALYLIEHLHADTATMPRLMFESTIVGSGMFVLASAVGGKLSDRLRRRKAFVCVGAAVYGMGLWLIAVADTYAAFLIGIATTGIGHGLYVGVDLALFTDLLPHQKRDAAKDLGLVNVTNTLPQILTPAIGPLILTSSHAGYTALFMICASLCFLGSLTILRVRRVR